ncbi:hypothetical protein [Paramagnetospirillum caucaseum]|uniref:hypothetical protein n=1 Tax=Paramagnetospirillum caucaseum TaxID=1244869 RepID=UPI0012692258|nr:hypothetical protein [Paramagnetospirillum caucaseum]
MNQKGKSEVARRRTILFFHLNIPATAAIAMTHVCGMEFSEPAENGGIPPNRKDCKTPGKTKENGP